MVVQAEHIPVHLGAMPEAVAAVMAHDPQQGEVWALNDPYTGGTHLPDITLVDAHRRWASPSAAHITPTSAGWSPPACRRPRREIYQEGLIIPPTRLDEGVLAADRRELAQPRRAPR